MGNTSNKIKNSKYNYGIKTEGKNVNMDMDAKMKKAIDESYTKTESELCRMKISIPKKLFITWKTKEEDGIPEHWKEAYKSVKKYCSDWEVFFFDDDDNRKFVIKHFPDYLETYDSLPYNIQRADVIRYMWLYVHGGVYKDMDLEIIRPMEILFQAEADLYLVHSANVKSVLTNSFMASKPKQKIWLDFLEHTKKNAPLWAVGKHLHVMHTTGPNALTKVVMDKGVSYMNLPSNICMPCSLCDLETCDTSEAIIKQHEGSSWLNWDGKFYNVMFCGWKNYYPIAIAIIIIIIFVILVLTVDLSG